MVLFHSRTATNAWLRVQYVVGTCVWPLSPIWLKDIKLLQLAPHVHQQEHCIILNLSIWMYKYNHKATLVAMVAIKRLGSWESIRDDTSLIFHCVQHHPSPFVSLALSAVAMSHQRCWHRECGSEVWIPAPKPKGWSQRRIPCRSFSSYVSALQSCPVWQVSIIQELFHICN